MYPHREIERTHKEHAIAISREIKQNLLKRLRRIEGQTRGLQRMVEENTYCVDIMN